MGQIKVVLLTLLIMVGLVGHSETYSTVYQGQVRTTEAFGTGDTSNDKMYQNQVGQEVITIAFQVESNQILYKGQFYIMNWTMTKGGCLKSPVNWVEGGQSTVIFCDGEGSSQPTIFRVIQGLFIGTEIQLNRIQ